MPAAEVFVVPYVAEEWPRVVVSLCGPLPPVLVKNDYIKNNKGRVSGLRRSPSRGAAFPFLSESGRKSPLTLLFFP